MCGLSEAIVNNFVYYIDVEFSRNSQDKEIKNSQEEKTKIIEEKVCDIFCDPEYQEAIANEDN